MMAVLCWVRAIQLEPEFLNRPEAFEIWLQHFDGTRGCNICIVDLPPAQWTGVALWRRLLLGEGDGLFPNAGTVLYCITLHSTVRAVFQCHCIIFGDEYSCFLFFFSLNSGSK